MNRILVATAAGFLLPFAGHGTNNIVAGNHRRVSPAEQSQSPIATIMTGRVMTVSGLIDPSALGHTLMHEHMFIDLVIPDEEPSRWRAAGRSRLVGATAVQLYNEPLALGNISAVMLGAFNRDNWQLNDERMAASEISAFRQQNGSTVVELTGTGMGREPQALRRVSRITGVNIVMGTGWYTAGWYPPDIESRSVSQLTDELVRDISVGVDGTGIRAGIIGEIGIGADPSSEPERRIIQASGHASRLTGAAITLHVSADQRQHSRVLDLLAAAGTDLSRVVLAHSDYLATDVSYLKLLLDRGVTISFDMLGEPPLVTRTRPIDSEVAQAIIELLKAGYADRIVLSQNVNSKIRWKAFGGTGYSFIEESFLPYLKRKGVDNAQIEQMIAENPRRILTFSAPQPLTGK